MQHVQPLVFVRCPLRKNIYLENCTVHSLRASVTFKRDEMVSWC